MSVPADAATKPKAAAPVAHPSAVVHVAPDFTWIGAGGKVSSSKIFRGQPVVILVAASPDEGDLRKEADRIQALYLEFSAKKAIFVGAFTAKAGRVACNVPFVIAQNGGAIAKAYGAAGKFSVVVIGPDGNVDMVSNKVEGAQRILDIINNTYQAQAPSRTGLGS